MLWPGVRGGGRVWACLLKVWLAPAHGGCFPVREGGEG